ncbi:hypothetical protein SLEP1_g42172 [Rubroshorea leprosula]|uniref:Hydroxyproline-rich glycoprotein family protein n=1 Tax=Rubroshorea leprosula TaxID=152421 RepID=A0AAV5LAB3_9ROSI|nr:hypothetical protein SLEP1_g42172 [Rubroshorea leprosula]
MAENLATQYSNKKRIWQPPSVPFLWEERPGIAKKDWKPGISSFVAPTLPPPVKLIASVPFNWEEEPGKPLPCFSPPPPQTAQPLILPLPPVCSQGCPDDSDSSDEHKGMFDVNFEAFGFETDDSYSSAPSLLTNCLLTSEIISTAVPLQENSQGNNSSDHLETPSSPASKSDDSSTSSYATGPLSLVGASFLECLFPLLPPKAGFLERVGHSEQGSQAPRELDQESTTTAVIRRPPTLGELIMMSRRRSYQRKALLMRKQNLSKEFRKKRASGCCIFGTSIGLIEGLEWKKLQRRLKLLQKT